MVYTHIMTTKELKAWRAKNGYSQAQLGKVLRVTSLTVSRWERGERHIPSFLHLALECIEKKGDEIRGKGKQKERKVKKHGDDL